MQHDTDRQLALLQEQNALLVAVASGTGMRQILTALTGATGRLVPGLRSCVLTADANGTAIAEAATAFFPEAFGLAIQGAPVSAVPFGTCGTAIHEGRPVGCADIAAVTTWAQPWRELCLAHGILAGHSTPIFDINGKAVASLFMCFSERRTPTDWELCVASMAAHIAGIALERGRTRAVELRALEASARLEQLLREREELLRRKDQFLAMLAHELRNPLAPIRTGLSILGHPDCSPARRDQVQTVMHRQLAHLVRLIDDLMDAARLAGGRLQLHRGTVDLRQVLCDALEGARPHLEARSQHVTVQANDDVMPVWGDATRLVQVFANLVGNASKFSGTGAHIVVTARATGEAVQVEVIDDGPGIPEDQLDAIFELYHQSGPQQASAGLGIGLALVKAFVELHGGCVRATSTPGRGSRFSVLLPARDGQAAHPPERAEGGLVWPLNTQPPNAGGAGEAHVGSLGSFRSDPAAGAP